MMQLTYGYQITELNGMFTLEIHLSIWHLLQEIFFIYSLINLKIYPLLGYGEVVYWVARNNTDNNTAIFLYFEFRADVFCKMKLESFPFDKQTCFLEVLPIFTFYLNVFNSPNFRKYS